MKLIPNLPITQQRLIIYLLEVIEKNGRNPQIIYPIFRQNLNQFNLEFAETLLQWARANFEQLSSENAYNLAALISFFSDLMLDFPLGNKNVNIAIVKAGYQSALRIFTQANFPGEWAEIQLNLGIAYEEDPQANSVQKWENAINCYRNASQVFTRNFDEQKWASIQENLGNAYRNRELGETAINLQESINYYQNALQVVTPQNNPKQWGVTKHNLGQSYFKLACLNPDESGQDSEQCLEIAISHFEEALPVLKKEIYPDLWALCQMSLGNAYSLRLRGNPYENHQKAENYYQNALQIFTSQKYPYYYQQVRTNQKRLQAMRDEVSQYVSQSNQADENSFVMKALSLALASQGDPQKIFSFLRQNLDQLNNQFIEDLIRIVQTLEQRNQYDRVFEEILTAILSFSHLIMAFNQGNRETNINIAIAGWELCLDYIKPIPEIYSITLLSLGEAFLAKFEENLGNLSLNLEEAIKYFEQGLDIFSSNDLTESEYLASCQNKLGVCYFYRHQNQGDPNDIIKAIKAYTKALDSFPKNSLPSAMVQVNLGNAYCLSQGNSLKNLNDAIKCYEDAEKIRTKEVFDTGWADVQQSLGRAYYERGMLGHSEREEDIELSIEYYKKAEEVYTESNYSQKWARIQIDLGCSYSDLQKGNWADNLEEAIKCLNNALEEITEKKDPDRWGIIKKILGIVYFQRSMGGRGEKLTNLITGINYCEEALKVFAPQKHQRHLVNYAETQGNLALIYRNIAKLTDPNSNLTKAISCAEEVVITFQNNPQRLGKACFELATCYKDLGLFLETNKDETLAKENFTKAIEYYIIARDNTPRNSNPFGWADITNSLGNAYQHKGEYEEAVKCYQDTLEIHTREAFPTDYIKTYMNMGNTHAKFKQLAKAYKSYFKAIYTLEKYLIYQLGVDDDAKRKLGEEWFRLYPAMVEVCLKLGKQNPKYLAKAWKYVERSKARRFVELFGLTQPAEVSDEDWKQYKDLRNKRANEYKRIEDQEKSNIGGNITIDRTQLNELKTGLDTLLNQNPKLNDIGKIQYTPFKGIGQHLTDDHTVVIQWYILAGKFCAFIYTRNIYQPHVWESSEADFNDLQQWWLEYSLEYNTNFNQWSNKLEDRLKKLANILHIDQLFGYIPPNCTQIILIPHRYLHLLPIHALSLKDGSYLLDRFSQGITYYPSFQLLKLAPKRKNVNVNNQRLFAIQNPDSSLKFADCEVQTIASFFKKENVEVLVNQNATKANFEKRYNQLASVAYFHFSCHGKFNNESPLDSLLLLANKDELTLAEIFKLHLSQCLLVTLSACETGLTDFTAITDEYIGFPSSFLSAGASSIVSSLWSVYDPSSAFFMIKFYQILLKQPGEKDVIKALKSAQYWLRNVTQDDLFDLIESCNLPSHIEDPLKQFAKQLNENDKPFSNPYYWAAFCVVGK